MTPGKNPSQSPSGQSGRGNWRQQARLVSGLVLFAFCVSHFLNHMLGIWSVEAMRKGEQLHHAIWGELPGQIVLLVAALTHVILALWRTTRRRTLRLPVWESLQLVLGLYIPWTLIPHVIATVGLDNAFDLPTNYSATLALLWPDNAFAQSVLLIVVWIHAMIGLHFWLKLKPWYRRNLPVLSAAAAAFPLLSLWGWISGARQLAASGDTKLNVTNWHLDWVYTIADQARAVVFGLFFLSLAVVLVRIAIRQFAKTITVEYPGNLLVRTAPGPSLLEISRDHGIAHAAVCGGRARCSTCRVKILAGGENLDPPNQAEAAVLRQIGADSSIRLACQIRPTSDLRVHPLIPVRAAERGSQAHQDAYYWGVEQPVVIMFVDIRDFTGLTEKTLSFDVVYLLNRYLDLVSDEIRRQEGYVDKFIGDGIMAIFGMETGLREGARQALRASKGIVKVIDALNGERGNNLRAPLRIGIGLHAGPVILGRIGAAGGSGERSSITALGDVVNTASRLEAENKVHGSLLTMSDAVVKAAEIRLEACETREILLRGKSVPLQIYSLTDLDREPVPV
ncbi:adenylate/guanylate cyclase domain-containing protein [Roseibium aggregatum]|nr:adenylate/guanylate cyclase domain-containing protein [Roseibium aggregatum]